MGDRLRWLVRLAALALALTVAVPAGQQLHEAHRPMPLPSHTWTLAPASVQVRPARIPRAVAPLTVYIPELGVTMPFHDAGQTDGWLDVGHTITSGVHFADGSTLDHGTYLVAAHVNSRDLSLSPFAKLWRIEPGTVIVVTDAQVHAHAFTTVGLNHYGKDHLPADLWSTTGPSSVALVTCGGRLTVSSDGSRHYADNVVVRGVAISRRSAEPGSGTSR